MADKLSIPLKFPFKSAAGTQITIAHQRSTGDSGYSYGDVDGGGTIFLANYAYVNPAVAVLLGIVFVGETIGMEEALAMLVIISAVLLISLPQWRKPKPK